MNSSDSIKNQIVQGLILHNKSHNDSIDFNLESKAEGEKIHMIRGGKIFTLTVDKKKNIEDLASEFEILKSKYTRSIDKLGPGDLEKQEVGSFVII